MRILISDSSSYKSVVVTRYLKSCNKDCEIFTCSHLSASKIFHTKYSDKHFLIDASNVRTRQYIKSLSEIINNNKIELFIPINSSEMDNVIKNKCSFGKSLDYWGNYEQFSTLNEKDKLYSFAKSLGVRIPYTYRSLEEAKIPFVIKPIKSSSSKGVVYIKSENEFKNYKKLEAPTNDKVIQEYVEGKGVGYSVYAINGRIQVGYGHLRLAEYPISGGSSVYRTGFVNKEMERISSLIMDKIGWSGFAMLEFKLTNSGEICLIEVNPRIWGSINQGLQNGVNYFSSLIRDSATTSPSYGINTFLSPLLYVALLKYVLSGKFSYAMTFLRNYKINKPDVSIISDPKAYIGLFLKL